MSGSITWGHVLTALALLLAAAAAAFMLGAMRHAGHGRGTPGYARARTGRRSALYAVTLAILVLAAGYLTPLWDLPLTSALL